MTGIRGIIYTCPLRGAPIRHARFHIPRHLDGIAHDPILAAVEHHCIGEHAHELLLQLRGIDNALGRDELLRDGQRDLRA